MLSILFLACAPATILLDDTAAGDTAEQPEPAPTVEETYLCASGGQASHAHTMATAVWPGVTDAEIWTVYEPAYVAWASEAAGYEVPSIDVALDVSLDDEGHVLVSCEWLEVDGYAGRVEGSYTLVVRG